MQAFSRFRPGRRTDPPQTNRPDPPVTPGPSTRTFMPTQSGAILSRGVSIKGSVKFLNELLIDGEVEGTIDSTGTLTIGEHARIRGEIRTKSVKVRGTVEGDRVTKWLVWSGFDRNKSSRKTWFKLANGALPHEQGHLDINELHSRRLAKMSLDMLPHGEGADPKEASADLRRKVEALADRVSGEAKKEHDQYDAETAHGKNLPKQREWSAAIQARLERAGIHF
jgi:Polymer-forming cytoskeletal/Bacterial protein of unknown function (DUF922)